MNQFELNFDAGLTERYETFAKLLTHVVNYGHTQQKKIAADLDMQPSVLSRMVNENDTSVNFPAHRLPDLIEATGDLRLIHWLVEKYCADKEDRRKRALNLIEALAPQLQAALKTLGEQP
jgi:hypothetical protein